MLAAMAKFNVQEGKEEEFKAAGAELAAGVKANEHGRTLLYSVTQSQSAPTEFFFFEAYADKEAIAEHGKTPHMAAFAGKLAGLLNGRPEITRLTPIASID